MATVERVARWAWRTAYMGFPMFVTAVVLAAFAVGGTNYQVNLEPLWQGMAGAAAALCVASAFAPERGGLRTWAATAVVLWFGPFFFLETLYLSQSGSISVSPYDVLLQALPGVLVAWWWGRPPIPPRGEYRRSGLPDIPYRGGHWGENLTPHFSPRTGPRRPGGQS